jgi:hypothetical protein
MQVEEGAKVQGQVAVGASEMESPSKGAKTEKVGGGGKADDLEAEPEPEGKAERQTSESRQTESELDQRQQQPSGD